MELEENLGGNKLYLVVAVTTNKEYQYNKHYGENMTALAGMVKNMVVPSLFHDLMAEKKTGTTIFGFGTAVKKIYVSNGDIVFAASNVSEDRLGECMIHIGSITREQRDRSLEAALADGKKFGAVLIEKELITPRQLVAGISQQIRQITMSVFSWYGGCYIFDEASLPDIIEIKIGTVNLIVDGIRNIDWEMARRSFSAIKTVLRQTDNTSSLFHDVKLDLDQQLVFSLVDGKKNIAEICSLSGLGDYNALKALYVLCALREVE